MSLSGYLSRARTIATPEFSRWLVLPAALGVHRTGLRCQRFQSTDDKTCLDHRVEPGWLGADRRNRQSDRRMKGDLRPYRQQGRICQHRVLPAAWVAGLIVKT